MKVKYLLTLFFLVCFLGMGYSQFTTSGTVLDADGTPLIGVSVAVKGSVLGTITDLDGKYSLEVPGQSATLLISYLGFASQELEVDGNSSSLIITLSSQTTVLDEVVVTGLATSVKRSNAANSVATVAAHEISGISVPTTTDAALYGKFKGANITANSGAPGGGLSLKLRGITSINGSSQPLFIIDGVYIDNSSVASGLNIVSAAAGGGSQSNQDNPSNRLADIDPNDIETIEILKGASAAAIYGSRAAGGVVIITTKKGVAGETKVRLSQSVGQVRQLNKLGVRQWTEESVLASSFAGDIDNFRAAQSSGTVRNYEDILYGNNGMLYNTRLSISGGTERTQFFIGGTYKNEEGIVNNTGYEKAAIRVNIDHKLADWIDISATSNYINSSSDRGFFNNDNSGTTMGVAFSSTPTWAQLLPDENGIYPSNPYAPSNFLETAANVTNREGVNRFISGITANIKLISNDNSSLKMVLRGGLDNYTLNTTALFPNTLQFQRDGNGLNGVSVQGFTKNINTNLAAFLVHSYYLDNGLSLRTSVGVTQENFDRNTILGEGTNLIGVQTNLDQSGSRNITQTREIQEDKGFIAQEEINFNDKIIATIGMRADKSSNNGDANKLFYYPKANMAINLHKFDMLAEGGAISQLKLRVAYGESGNFAKFGAKSTVLNSSIIDGVAGVTVPNLLGNADVGPERQKEIEFGFDLGLNSNKILFDFTYYVKSVEDLLLNADIPTSTGFTSKVTNAAQLRNKGIEIGLNFNVIDQQDVNWFSRVSFWKNKAEVTELKVPNYTDGGFADFLGQFRIIEGRSPTEIIGVGATDLPFINGDNAELRDSTGLIVFGDAEPDFQMSFYNEISFKRFDLSFLVHWKQGGENINLSSLLFDLNGTTHDYDDLTLDPEGALGNGDYRLSLLGADTGPYVEDAGYVRLREIGLYYNLPSHLFNDAVDLKVGFSGTNLLNFFSYNSYDPEVSNFGSGGLSTGVEVLPFPSSKRFDFHIIANF